MSTALAGSSTSEAADENDRELTPLQQVGERWLGTNGSGAIATKAFMATLVASAIVAAAVWYFLFERSNNDANVALQFAGAPERLADRQDRFTFDEAVVAQYWGMALAVVWGVVGWVLFSIFWRHCWNVGFAARSSVDRDIRWLPVGGAILAIVERVLALLVIQGTGPDGQTVQVRNGWHAVLSALAWAKWVLVATTVLAVLGMLLASLTRTLQPRRPSRLLSTEIAELWAGDLYRASPDELAGTLTTEEREAALQPPPPDGRGICCSGGGVRAANFALGALSFLERHPNVDGPVSTNVLGESKYLSSVSGGGYAAGGWRVAAGTGDLDVPPFIGDPRDLRPDVRRYPEQGAPPATLLDFVRENRRFIANGRGGLPTALTIALAQLVWHAFLIAATVYLFAWPLGALIAAWPVDALADAEGGQAVDRLSPIGEHRWKPVLYLLAPAALPLIYRMTAHRSRRRYLADRVFGAVMTLGVGAAIVLLVLPWLSAFVSDVVPGQAAGRAVITGVWAVVIGALWQLAKKYVAANARFLGGVVLGVGVLAAALVLIHHVALEFVTTSNDDFTWSFWLWIALLALMTFAFVRANPDRWSLHDFYRRRITQMFATRRSLRLQGGEATWAVEGLTPAELDPLNLYQGEGFAGPSPIICCAAARESAGETGIAALSMTFEPEAVTLYGWQQDSQSLTAKRHVDRISHAEFVDRLPGTGYRVRLGSVIGAAAVSGAAVAPAMGRHDMSTTNAMLAAFNARLGVWLPNPAFVEPSVSDRRIAPRLVNMFKEIFGVYQAADPNVYVTDGGHWDNLGLIELVRRRCETIIAIDASGDPPGTYKALRQAIVLARHECGAHIDFSPDQWARLDLDDEGLVAHNHMVGTVTYRDGATATIVYVKAVVSQTSTLALQRFAAGDPTFPNYPTFQLLLSDRQMTSLMSLGYEAMAEAITEHSRALGLDDLADEPTSPVLVDEPPAVTPQPAAATAAFEQAIAPTAD